MAAAPPSKAPIKQLCTSGVPQIVLSPKPIAPNRWEGLQGWIHTRWHLGVRMSDSECKLRRAQIGGFVRVNSVGFVGNWAAVNLWKRSFTAALESSERHPGASSVQSSDSEPNILALRCHQEWIWTDRILPRKPSDLCSVQIHTWWHIGVRMSGSELELGWHSENSMTAVKLRLLKSTAVPNERQDCVASQSHFVQISAQSFVLTTHLCEIQQGGKEKKQILMRED